MSLKAYLILMSIATAICWAAWLFVVTSMDPGEAKTAGFFFFYSSLYLALLGSFSVIGFALKEWLFANPATVLFNQVKRAFWQGALAAGAVIFALLLQQFRILRWWNVILLLFVIGICLKKY
ncbi:hypothetical protein EPN28_03050 [Patescibacteria group bacterium]|nr:MAG: hypothetical protein EPN28_03050 [Patescibacteria group bacterium]